MRKSCQALTNNAIDTGANASSLPNLSLSLPPSSSMFPSALNQSYNTSRKEKLETNHNSKGDILD
jgi:hypothetical protein